jgi:hypothetical protein
MHYSIVLWILISATAMNGFGQERQGESVDSASTKTLRIVDDDPIIFLNDVIANQGEVDAFDPMQIAFITIVDDTVGRDASPTGKQGAVYVYTKEYARSKYWNYFKQASPAYANAIPSPEQEREVAYILNGEVLELNIESELYDLIGANIRLQVIDGKELKKRFKVKNKKLGVMITKEGK